jgi:hypothetical protein
VAETIPHLEYNVRIAAEWLVFAFTKMGNGFL